MSKKTGQKVKRRSSAPRRRDDLFTNPFGEAENASGVGQPRDATDELEQCSATIPHGSDGYLCCRYVAGHTGKHATCYEDVGRQEWDAPVMSPMEEYDANHTDIEEASRGLVPPSEAAHDWTFSKEVHAVTDALATMLVEKNKAYGDSALNPVRIFAKDVDIKAGLWVRIDDKLSRLKRGSAAGEDAVLDLMGYLVMLRVQEMREKREKGRINSRGYEVIYPENAAKQAEHEAGVRRFHEAREGRWVVGSVQPGTAPLTDKPSEAERILKDKRLSNVDKSAIDYLQRHAMCVTPCSPTCAAALLRGVPQPFTCTDYHGRPSSLDVPPPASLHVPPPSSLDKPVEYMLTPKGAKKAAEIENEKNIEAIALMAKAEEQAEKVRIHQRRVAKFKKSDDGKKKR